MCAVKDRGLVMVKVVTRALRHLLRLACPPWVKQDDDFELMVLTFWFCILGPSTPSFFLFLFCVCVLCECW